MDITKEVCLPPCSNKRKHWNTRSSFTQKSENNASKMADGSPRGIFVSLTPSIGAIFTKGTDHFRSSCEQIWQLILNKHNIIAWICWPYIYAEWWSTYSILWCSKPARELPAVLSWRASTWFNCLPACKESFLTRKEYAICRSPPQIEAYSVGTRSVRRDLNAISDRKKTEI